MEIAGELLTIICGAVGIAFTATTAAITKLWDRQTTGETRLMSKLDECEKKHELCEKENARIWRHIAGQHDCPITAATHENQLPTA